MPKNTPIWASRLAWRVALAVFLTILVVQVAVYYVSGKDYLYERKDHLMDVSAAVLSPHLNSLRVNLSEPVIDEDHVQTILRGSNIKGFSVYRLDGVHEKTYGEAPEAPITSEFYDYLSEDWSRYERLLSPGDLAKPYRVLMRVDATNLMPAMLNHIRQAGLIVLLLSAFVTTVLMIVLGRWLIEPIMRLRHNLIGAAKDPGNAKKYITHSDAKDALGVMVRAANDLIFENAKNLKKLKSQAKDTIHQLAYYDSLTGLPNRTLFIQQLESMITEMQDVNDKKLAIAVVDLDHFKDVNDTMGHDVGDMLLAAVGQRLKKILPNDVYVSRSGEDEFAILAVLNQDEEVTDRVAGMVFNCFKEPFKIAGEDFKVKCSLGVSTYPTDGRDASKLVKSADIALNRAKEDGRDTARHYSADFDLAVQKRVQMVRDMRVAFDNKDFTLYYQPQFNLKTGDLIGAEALMRWFKKIPDSDKTEFISPVDFIPAAEQSGLILPMGKWALEEAVNQVIAWQKQGVDDVRMAVNISAIQFQQADLVKDVKDILKKTNLRPHLLEIEVTESLFMDDVNRTINTLERLNDVGIELAIDDFGTGYSSLSYLRQFPIDRLKIDQSFIRNALENDDDAAITKIIVSLGRALGIKVIAEGVETKEHEAFLKAQDCDEVQGYLYARPMPADEFLQFAKDYRRNNA